MVVRCSGECKTVASPVKSTTLALAWEGRPGAEAALVSRGATVTLSRSQKKKIPRLLGLVEWAPHLSPFSEPSPLHPQPNGWTTKGGMFARHAPGRYFSVNYPDFGGILALRAHCARTARALRATFRLCSPRRAPRHAPWKRP